MWGHESFDSVAGAQALIDWWQAAGVDEVLLDEPRGWLRPAMAEAASVVSDTPAPVRAPPSVAAPVAPSPVFPDSYEAFVAWLATGDDVPEAAWPGTRILPSGQMNPVLMVIADMPEAHDSDRLMSGQEGKLFDAMLRAIGLTRDAVHLASLAVARPAGGVLDSPEMAQLALRMNHHIGLVRPKKLLILGDRSAKAMGQDNATGRPANLPAVNHDGGTVAAVATHHPRFLLRHPTEKGAAWTAMRRLIEDAVP